MKSYRLYLEHVQLHGDEPVLSLTRAWTLVRFFDSGMLQTTACSRCGGHFVAHATIRSTLRLRPVPAAVARGQDADAEPASSPLVEAGEPALPHAAPALRMPRLSALPNTAPTPVYTVRSRFSAKVFCSVAVNQINDGYRRFFVRARQC